jgi:hypothetical protein
MTIISRNLHAHLSRECNFSNHSTKRDLYSPEIIGTGSAWEFGKETFDRPWPILTGERGEYEVANGGNGLPFLQTMANTANEAYMIPEQVWDTTDQNSSVSSRSRMITRSASRMIRELSSFRLKTSSR